MSAGLEEVLLPRLQARDRLLRGLNALDGHAAAHVTTLRIAQRMAHNRAAGALRLAPLHQEGAGEQLEVVRGLANNPLARALRGENRC